MKKVRYGKDWEEFKKKVIRTFWERVREEEKQKQKKKKRRKKKGEMPAIYYEKLQEIINKEIFGIPSYVSEDLAFRHDDDE